MIIKVIGFIIITIFLTFIYCCMKISSDKSRWEEIELKNKSKKG